MVPRVSSRAALTAFSIGCFSRWAAFDFCSTSTLFMEQKVEITIRIETVSNSPSAPSPGRESVIDLVVAILFLITAILSLIAAL
jgi:hypothetical protein